MPVLHGRRSVRTDQALAVFIVGMRVNRWTRPDVWWPVAAAMGPMLAELYADPGSGFLGHRSTLSVGGPLLVQYWRSADDVRRYARDAGRRHRPAWTAFNARAHRAPGVVGIWHELYDVRAEGAHATYVDMPAVGLDRALAREVAT